MKLNQSMLAAIAATALFAAPAIAADGRTAFSGPYVGLQGSYESFDIETDASDSTLGVSGSDEYSASGLAGGAFAGYGQRFGNAYLGAEIEGTLSSAKYESSITDGVDTVDFDIKHKRSIGASIRPGYVVNDDTLLYGRVGLVRSKFEAQSGGESDSENQTGVVLGVGAETMIASNVSLRADWTYTNYREIDATAGTTTVSFDPSSSNFRVGVGYNF